MSQPGAAASYYNDTGYQQSQEAPVAAPRGYQYNNQPQQYNQQPQQYNNQPQQYNQAQPEPKYNQPPPEYDTRPQYSQDGSKQSFDQTFKLQGPKWHDVWAAVLFIAVFLGFTAVSGLSLHGYSQTKGTNGSGIYGSDNTFGLSTNTIILFCFVLGTAFVLSGIYLMIARYFTKALIYITFVVQVVFGIGTAIVYFARHYYSAAIVFLIFTLFYIFCFFTWRKRIPFAVLMLQTVIDVANHCGHVFIVSFIGGVVALAFAAWFSVTLVAVYVKYEPGNNPACNVGGGSCSQAKVIGLVVFITFAAFWISEVIKNIIHTTVAGVYGSWYFCAGKPGGMPSGATRGAFRRSMTYSFGSISLGSLLASLVQMLRQLASVAQQSAASQGDGLAACAFCIVGCFIGILDWAVQWINHYAYCYIALYGKSYFQAAKATWSLIKDRGIDALINDCLIDPVLTMGAVFVGYVCTLLAYLYIEFTKPAYNQNGNFTPVVMAFAFLIGLQMANVFLVPLKSGTATIFVAAAWDPEVMMRDHSDLWQRMIKVYPHVQQAIHA